MIGWWMVVNTIRSIDLQHRRLCGYKLKWMAVQLQLELKRELDNCV